MIPRLNPSIPCVKHDGRDTETLCLGARFRQASSGMEDQATASIRRHQRCGAIDQRKANIAAMVVDKGNISGAIQIADRRDRSIRGNSVFFTEIDHPLATQLHGVTIADATSTRSWTLALHTTIMPRARDASCAEIIAAQTKQDFRSIVLV